MTHYQIQTTPAMSTSRISILPLMSKWFFIPNIGERGGSVVECRTPEREVGGSKPTTAVLCPWARHFTPRKYWLITQEAMAPSRLDWKIVDWDVKPQNKQTNIPNIFSLYFFAFQLLSMSKTVNMKQRVSRGDFSCPRRIFYHICYCLCRSKSRRSHGRHIVSFGYVHVLAEVRTSFKQQ